MARVDARALLAGAWLLAACPTDAGVTTTAAAAATDGATSTGGAAPTTGGASSAGDPSAGDGEASSVSGASSSGGASSGGASSGEASTGGVAHCGCAPDNADIVVLSDEGELWTYTPASGAFALLRAVVCPGVDTPYSLAVDRAGVAWIQYASDGNLYTFDPAAPGPCAPSGVVPQAAQLTKYFGLSFAAPGPLAACDRLFLFAYSGEGPFTEGPGIGALGVYDPQDQSIIKIGSTDYDGGELAGTGEGRLFAFAGADPAKLIEYDQASAEALVTSPLPGLRKTRASAFAFHGGDAWFFTEAVEASCHPCLEAACPFEFAACQGDPQCAEALACSIALGDVQDDCGGLMPPAMSDCAAEVCVADCYPDVSDVVSKVTRLDHDGSEGQGEVLVVVEPQAPIRIVGAAASTCAPSFPQ